MERLKLGLIGLGQRGAGLYIEGGGLMGTVFGMDDAVVSAVCDTYSDRVERAAQLVAAHGDPEPFQTTDYRELLWHKPDAVIISAAWEVHTEIACACMQAGIPVGVEVGGAYDLQSCWDLVDCFEQTRTPFMFLENCCYGKDELLVSALLKNGLLGKISFCQGAYCHDLRNEIAEGLYTKHYRLRNYLSRNCENYPTHELGPIAKLLDINRGNRMTKLVSMASKSAGLAAYVQDKDRYAELRGKKFAQGDVVTTMIECENGETILLKLDTTLPRLYERGLTVSGTKGFYCQTTQSVILDDGCFDHEKDSYSKAFFSQKDYGEYMPEVWKTITPEQIKAGHGGIDYIMLKQFVQDVKRGELPLLDVYDAAAWMCVTALSEQSIAAGSAAVDVPDFTRGKYRARAPQDLVPLPIVKDAAGR